jgi:LmbE family N-acetylglucosaminyl deacetylase
VTREERLDETIGHAIGPLAIATGTPIAGESFEKMVHHVKAPRPLARPEAEWKSENELIERLIDPTERLRVLIVVAHPDDETIGIGGHLFGLDLAAVVHLTDGAPRDPWFSKRLGLVDRAAYAEMRRRELLGAMAATEVQPARLMSLGFVDQEVARHLERAARRVRALVEELEPEVVLTHPYEGGHPDHDATAFAVQAARRMLGDRAPPAIEMAYYHRRNGTLLSGMFLPGPTRTRTVLLDRRQRERKKRMIDCFRSQAYVLSDLDVRFERFRIAPTYEFIRPPHEGPLHYETLGWQIDGVRFRRFAADALAALFGDE